MALIKAHLQHNSCLDLFIVLQATQTPEPVQLDHSMAINVFY